MNICKIFSEKFLNICTFQKKAVLLHSLLVISRTSFRIAVIFATAPCIIAIVAQLVEQRIRNAWVAGSSPASGSKRHPAGCLFLFHPSTHNFM